jgi:hypothetical protein
MGLKKPLSLLIGRSNLWVAGIGKKFIFPLKVFFFYFFSVLRFSTEEEADKAIEKFDKTILNDRKISLRKVT